MQMIMSCDPLWDIYFAHIVGFSLDYSPGAVSLNKILSFGGSGTPKNYKATEYMYMS